MGAFVSLVNKTKSGEVTGRARIRYDKFFPSLLKKLMASKQVEVSHAMS